MKYWNLSILVLYLTYCSNGYQTKRFRGQCASLCLHFYPYSFEAVSRHNTGWYAFQKAANMWLKSFDGSIRSLLNFNVGNLSFSVAASTKELHEDSLPFMAGVLRHFALVTVTQQAGSFVYEFLLFTCNRRSYLLFMSLSHQVFALSV